MEDLEQVRDETLQQTERHAKEQQEQIQTLQAELSHKDETIRNFVFTVAELRSQVQDLDQARDRDLQAEQFATRKLENFKEDFKVMQQELKEKDETIKSTNTTVMKLRSKLEQEQRLSRLSRSMLLTELSEKAKNCENIDSTVAKLRTSLQGAKQRATEKQEEVETLQSELMEKDTAKEVGRLGARPGSPAGSWD